MKPPVAAKFLRCMISVGLVRPVRRREPWRVGSRSKAAVEVALLLGRVAGLAQLVPARVARAGAMRSRMSGSAWSRSQVGVSMMWASASWTTRPVELYGTAPVWLAADPVLTGPSHEREAVVVEDAALDEPALLERG